MRKLNSEYQIVIPVEGINGFLEVIFALKARYRINLECLRCLRQAEMSACLIRSQLRDVIASRKALLAAYRAMNKEYGGASYA